MIPVYAYTLRQEYNRGIEKLESLEKELDLFQTEVKLSHKYTRQHQYNRKFALRKIEETKRSILAIQAKNRMLDACINAMCTFTENGN